jgi:hypothetical protein
VKASSFRTGLLKATDLSTTPTVVEIVSATKREFDGKDKVVIHTTGFSGRGLTLNQTRLDALAETLGDETDDWIGKEIIVKRGSAQFKGQRVAAIEIQPVSSGTPSSVLSRSGVGRHRASLVGAPPSPPPHTEAPEGDEGDNPGDDLGNDVPL